MAGPHLHLRPLTLAAVLAVAALLAGSCSCADRPVDDDLADGSEPACLWLINPRAFRADGSRRMIIDDPYSRSGTACLCITQDEYDALGDRLDRVGWPPESTLLAEFNVAAYAECKRLSALIEDVVGDECLDYYHEGRWLKDIYFARGDWANGTPAGFSCPADG